MKLLKDTASLDELSRDAGITRIRPQLAAVAESEAEVDSAVRKAMEMGIPITPRGGGTSIPSQSVGAGMVLLQETKGVAFLSRGEVACGSALVKSELNKLLEQRGLWMPVDPSSYASCTVGGMVANNASGVRTPKYGSTVDYVARLRAFLIDEGVRSLKPMDVDAALSADERTKRIASLISENARAIIQERPKVTKNSSGYRLERVIHDGLFDLPKLFVGSEGTLGIVTEATFKTVERPKWRLLFVVESSLDELNHVAGAFLEHSPAALELVDKSVFHQMGKQGRVAKYSRSEEGYMVFCELDGKTGTADGKVSEVAGTKAGSYDPVVLASQSEIAEAWEVRNETLTLAQEIRKDGKILVPGVEDLVVPPDRLADLVRLLADQFGRRGLESISYGHAGDANIHARPLLDPTTPAGRRILDELMDECFEAVWKMGGSITGEHGDGMLRARYVERQYPRTYWIMKEVRRIFDPKGVLSPGVKIV